MLKDTTQCLWWGSNLQLLDLMSCTLPLSHCAPLNETVLLSTQNMLEMMGKKIFRIVRWKNCLSEPVLAFIQNNTLCLEASCETAAPGCSPACLCNKCTKILCWPIIMFSLQKLQKHQLSSILARENKNLVSKNTFSKQKCGIGK